MINKLGEQLLQLLFWQFLLMFCYFCYFYYLLLVLELINKDIKPESLLAFVLT